MKIVTFPRSWGKNSISNIVDMFVSQATVYKNVSLRKSKRRKKFYAETLLLLNGFYCPYTSFQQV